MRVLTALLCAALAAGACSSSRGGEPSTPPASRTSGAEGVDAAAQSLSNEPDASQPVSASTPGPVTLVEVDRAPPRPTPTPPPRVVIRAPLANAALRENRLEVRLEVERWRNVSDPADLRHLCVALDAEPCRRVDDPARPVVLEGLREGPHVVRAWAAWEDHAAVASSLVQTPFFVGPAVRDGGVDPAAPGLVAAAPDGELTGAHATVVMVDLLPFPVATQSSGAQGFRARITVDGSDVGERAAPGPFGLMGLAAGAHTLTFTLLGPDGAPRGGALQRAERRVWLRDVGR
jgi:hypothetical protein